MSCMCPLINYTLATEENVCKYESAHDAITFVITCNKFDHNTQPDAISDIRTRFIFQRFFLRENIGDFA